MEWVIGIVALLIGAGGGAALGFLFAERRASRAGADAATSTALAEQRATALDSQLQDAKAQAESLRALAGAAEKEVAATRAQLQSTQQNLIEQKKLLDDAQVQLREAFASVSVEALSKNNEAFLALATERFGVLSAEANGSLEQRKAQIDGMLKPMAQLLSTYQQRVGEIEKSRVESYSMLREQLGILAETQRTLNSQTGQLVSALRRPQTRGQWGEITLRRLVELAGMSSKCDFVEQASVDGEDGKLRPDLVVNLPGDRQIIIDCKAALDAFLDAAAATDDDARKVCLQRHCQQVRARARELSVKSYWTQFERSPDFVIMFLPGEAFLYAAVEFDPSLVEDFLKNNVIIATPTTLIGLLKTIELGWRQEEVTQNAEEIRKHGKDLYERIAVLASHFAKLGDSLGTAVNQYNVALGSLETRVTVTARKISELGARSDKELPELTHLDARPRDVSAALLPAGE